MKTDFERYHELTRTMQCCPPDTAEFQNAWRELETIKNRHGGMPPPEPPDEYALELEQCENANEQGLR